MATCRDIVTRALRMAGIVDREEDPSGAELRDGMLILNSLYEGWLIGGMFGRLTDVYEPGDYGALEGERVFVVDGTVTLPTTIDDERQPRDLSAIEVADNGGRRAYVWDSTGWAQITGLEAGDEAPLSTRGMNGLAACVAASFAEEFGAQIGPFALRQAGNFKTALSLKLGTERQPSEASYY